MGIDWDQVTNFIIDMDGVIYRGKQPIPGSREFILFLRERKAKIAFFSNNSTITSDQFIQKLTGMDIIATKNEFVSSGFITAYNIQKENSSARVFCIGEAGIREELQKAGIRMVDDPPDDRVDYVVVGLDHQFNYAKMAKAMRCILNGARFLGTNPDLTFPLEDGLTPGCGALLASIEACTGVRPRIMGKPHPESIRFLLEITGFQRENSIFIGDRIDTDIQLAKKNGILSVLVLTGVSQRDDVEKTGVVPDVVVDDLRMLLRMMTFPDAEVSDRWPK